MRREMCQKGRKDCIIQDPVGHAKSWVCKVIERCQQVDNNWWFEKIIGAATWRSNRRKWGAVWQEGVQTRAPILARDDGHMVP